MKLLTSLLLGSIAGLVAISPAQAQQPVLMAEKTSVDKVSVKREYVARYRKVILDKCNETAEIDDPVERYNSCRCYVDSYIDRYTPETLAAINAWSSKNPGKSSLILIMLQPERNKCKIP